MGRAVSLLKRFTARTATTETLESRMVYALTAIKKVAARCDTPQHLVRLIRKMQRNRAVSARLVASPSGGSAQM